MCLGPGLIFWYNLNSGKRILRFGTCNVRSQYRSGSLTTVAREFASYKLDLVDVQKLGGAKGTVLEQGIVFFSMEKEKKIINWEQDFLCTTE